MKFYRIALFASIMLLIFSISTASTEVKGPDIDESTARTQLGSQIYSLLMQEKFEELEKIANNLHKSKARFPDGGWKIFAFYTYWPDLKDQPKSVWDTTFQKLELWKQKYPNSTSASVALGNTYVNYAWAARGAGYAYEVTEEGFRLFRERLGQAYDVLRIEPSDKKNDCPERYRLLLKIAKGLGWERGAYDNLFRKAIAFDPDYYGFYNEQADYLSKRWYGEEREWLKFAKNAKKYVNSNEKKTIYTRIAWSMAGKTDFLDFKNSGVSWELMKQGFDEIELNFPNSQVILNIYCKFACIAADKPTTRKLLKKINDKPDLAQWQNLYEQCRNWAEDGAK